MPTLSAEKLSRIREAVPDYAGLDDNALTARLMVDYPELSGQAAPTEQRAFGTGSRAQLAGDVAETVRGAGVMGGALVGAASPYPGGAVAGATVGGAAGRLAGLKVYDYLGVKRPDETKFFGLVNLGEQNPLKETFTGMYEGALSEGIPAALAIGGRSARNAFISRSLGKAASLPPNFAVANTATREGIPLGVDEITQSPMLRGLRAREAKTAIGATNAQVRSAAIEDAATQAVQKAMSEIGTQGSPSAVAADLRGQPGAPGVLGKIDADIRAQTNALYKQVDSLAGDKPIINLKNLRSTADDLMSRAESTLKEKGFGQTMKRSRLGQSIVKEASTPPPSFDLSKLSGGQYLPEDLPPDTLAQLKAAYPTEPDKPLTFAEADQLRSRYGEIVRDAKRAANPDSRVVEAATRLKNAIDADMNAAADSLPKGSDLKTAYDNARSFVRGVRDKSFKTAVKYLRDSDPTELAKSIAPNDTELVKGINNVLDKGSAFGGDEAKEAIRRMWTHDYFFGEGSPTRTELTTITNKAKKLSPEFLDEMFGSPGTKPRDAFDRMVEIGRAAERVDFQLGTRPTTEEVGQAMDTAAGLFSRSKWMAVGGLKRFATSHLLTKAVNDPKLYDMVLRGIYAYPRNPARSLAAFTQAIRVAYPMAKIGLSDSSPPAPAQ